jgi:hypothetical protein
MQAAHDIPLTNEDEEAGGFRSVADSTNVASNVRTARKGVTQAIGVVSTELRALFLPLSKERR